MPISLIAFGIRYWPFSFADDRHLPNPLPTFNLYQRNFYTNLIGSIIAGGGFYIMAICIRNYFNKLSGIEWLTKNEDTIAIGTALVMKGIHKKVRHPLYLGTFLLSGVIVIYPTEQC
ncbi:MAG: hypothetical protein IPP79_16645 [Chitinophagaceae bacterium]|nr:hypothetical protein [Chitinophagaceae bacterium]